MLSNLPTYKITIDDEYSNGEDLGIKAIAFVTNPAIQVKGFAFNETDIKQSYFADKTKYRIVAPAMIPMQIYRADDSGEYYVEFTEKEVERIYSKFMKNFTNRQVFNLEHDANDKVPAYVLESWIVENPIEDKAYSSYGIQVPKGTVMVTAQITDKETYNQIVENEQFAFSIEGFLGLSLSEIINKQKQKNEKMSEQKMSMPAGQYTMGNQIFTVLEDGTFSVSNVSLEDDECKDCKDEADCKKCKEAKEAKVGYEDAPKEDEVKKEEMQDEVIVEDAPAMEYPTYTKEEIDAKFDELYQLIADLKNEKEIVVEDAPALMSEVKMSTQQIFESYLDFAKNGKNYK